MTAPEQDQDVEVVHWYTLARRFPQLIGRTPDGRRIWGGPYTYTQAIGGTLVLYLGAKTTSAWGNFGVLGNVVVLLGAAWLTTFVLGRLPPGSRSPLSVAAGALRAVTAPQIGRCGGRPLRIRRPHVVTSRIAITAPAVKRPPSVRTTAPDPTPVALLGGLTVDGAVTSARPTPATRPPAPRAAPALTGVQRLLAAAGEPTET